MKISHFPDFLPDETVYSVAGRYMDRMQFRSPSTVSQHFFGTSSTGMITDLPSHLDHLVKALPSYHKYTSDMIIDQNTLFPFYVPFLPAGRATVLRQRMRSNDAFVHTIAGVTKSKASRIDWLRYCPACVYRDRITYGECYWHRLHQIPGVLVCPVHEIMLEDSFVKMLRGQSDIEFRSAECSVSDMQQRKIPTRSHTLLVQIANNAKWLLEQKISLEQNYIQQRYLKLLAYHGFVTATGKVRYSRLKSAILDYYSPDLLEDLGCNIRELAKDPSSFAPSIIHPVSL